MPDLPPILLRYIAPLVYALALWWASTAAIILLYRLPQRTYRLSFVAITLAALASLYGVWLGRGDASMWGAYLGFTCGTLVWGWQLAGFYMGFVTGPRQEPFVWHPSNVVRFGQAIHASLHHELAALGGAGVLAALSWNAPNMLGLWTYLLLWLMHLAAKINIFLGARNFHAGLLPDHLRYLGVFLRYRPMNAFFPLSVTGAVVIATLFWRWALHPNASDFEAVAGALLGFLTLLGLLEIWLLMTPPVGKAWGECRVDGG
ncbi:MAG: putative photosynthetic complex assembly protein PuhE [Roseiflexus sp.]|nr:putative photosynthetic complex assembly protein PuhE [Roseiflexus sp.]MCS7288687.1 putative photosynthetic complex assembly protein PuhE [Roseiflexus sp.]MDW8233602.1 putative photosynthetic complex assembly protein PuhE [Roseiflexaceae bacterium]